MCRAFSEVLLDRIPESTVPLGELHVRERDQWHKTEHTTTVRFTNPRWQPLADRELVGLLGQEAVYELYAMAGIKGDYTPERLFGAPGRRLAEEIRAHNHSQAGALFAHTREWQAGA